MARAFREDLESASAEYRDATGTRERIGKEIEATATHLSELKVALERADQMVKIAASRLQAAALDQ